MFVITGRRSVVRVSHTTRIAVVTERRGSVCDECSVANVTGATNIVKMRRRNYNVYSLFQIQSPSIINVFFSFTMSLVSMWSVRKSRRFFFNNFRFITNKPLFESYVFPQKRSVSRIINLRYLKMTELVDRRQTRLYKKYYKLIENSRVIRFESLCILVKPVTRSILQGDKPICGGGQWRD